MPIAMGGRWRSAVISVEYLLGNAMPYEFRPSIEQNYCPSFDSKIKRKNSPGLNWDSQKAGRYIDPATVQKTFKLTSRHKYFHDLSMILGWTTVSMKARKVIETLEPNVHQFIPVKILRKNGEPFDGEHFIFNVCQVIDAIIVGESDATRKDFTDFYTGEPSFAVLPNPAIVNHKYAFDSQKIANKHAWRGKHHMPTITF